MLPSSQVLEKVTSGELDVGFVSGRQVGRGVRVEATKILPVCVVVGPGHRFFGRDRLSLHDLHGLSVVLPDATFGIRREVDRACRQRRVVTDLIGETNTLTLALELALARDAATLLTLAALPRDADSRGICAIPIGDKRLASSPVSLVVSREPRRAEAAHFGVRLGKELLNSRAVSAWA